MCSGFQLWSVSQATGKAMVGIPFYNKGSPENGMDLHFFLQLLQFSNT